MPQLLVQLLVQKLSSRESKVQTSLHNSIIPSSADHQKKTAWIKSNLKPDPIHGHFGQLLGQPAQRSVNPKFSRPRFSPVQKSNKSKCINQFFFESSNVSFEHLYQRFSSAAHQSVSLLLRPKRKFYFVYSEMTESLQRRGTVAATAKQLSLRLSSTRTFSCAAHCAQSNTSMCRDRASCR